MSIPAFCPTLGGFGSPMGRLRGLGVKSDTALPCDRGASSSGDVEGATGGLEASSSTRR